MLDQHTLAIVFVSLMGLATLMYAILDGYDLGVGILLPLNHQEHSDSFYRPLLGCQRNLVGIGHRLIAYRLPHCPQHDF